QNQLAEGCGIAEHSPQPRITAHLEDDSINLDNWFFSPSVDLYINHTFIESRVLISGRSYFSLTSTMNSGDVITFQSGTYSTSYTVGVLEATSFDKDSRILNGIALPGELVVTYRGNQQTKIIIQVDQSGDWSLTIPEDVTVSSGTLAMLQQFDQKGNSVTSDYLLGEPYMNITQGRNGVEGYGFPAFTPITVEVNGQVLDTGLTDEVGGYFHTFNHNFVIGDVVRLSAGGYSVDQTITLLSVDMIDTANNFLAGKATPGSLTVRVSGVPYSVGTMKVEVDTNGDWQAHFSEMEPWNDDVSGYILQCQSENSCQQLPWYNRQYLIAVDPASDHVEMNRWEPYSDLQITIASQTWNATTDYSGSARINTGAYDIIGGDLVTITDGVRTKAYTVTNLIISNVDPVNRSLEGTADPNTNVLIRKTYPPNDSWKTVTTDNAGIWQIYFEDEIFSDTDVFVKQTDSAGDMTQIVWKFGAPTIWAYLKENKVVGRNWTANMPVTLTIEGNTWTETSDSYGFVEFRLSNFSLEPNQLLEMSNTVQNQSYQIKDLYITSIKANDSLVFGFADGGSVNIKACAPIYYGCFMRTANTDADGNWQADFKPDLQLNYRYFGTVYLYDDELNGTIVDWALPSDILGLSVMPWSNVVYSSWWGTHSKVSLLIDGVEIVKDQPTVYQTVSFYNVPSDLLVPGAVIKLKDENFSIYYTINDFKLIMADPETNVLMGTADYNDVIVEACSGKCETITASWIYDPSSGKYRWVADFNGILDLTKDSFGTITLKSYGYSTTLYHWRAFSSCYNFLPVISKTD
ncbi:MAG: hypothetical protein ACOYKC_10100, partial [Anaerolineaceae bacterium]